MTVPFRPAYPRHRLRATPDLSMQKTSQSGKDAASRYDDAQPAAGRIRGGVLLDQPGGRYVAYMQSYDCRLHRPARRTRHRPRQTVPNTLVVPMYNSDDGDVVAQRHRPGEGDVLASLS